MTLKLKEPFFSKTKKEFLYYLEIPIEGGVFLFFEYLNFFDLVPSLD